MTINVCFHNSYELIATQIMESIALNKQTASCYTHSNSNHDWHQHSNITIIIIVYTPCERLGLNDSSARQICSSNSKGMSPHTMSYRSIPRDQTAADLAWYRWCLIHSGGLYTLVPIRNNNIIVLRTWTQFAELLVTISCNNCGRLLLILINNYNLTNS